LLLTNGTPSIAVYTVKALKDIKGLHTYISISELDSHGHGA